MKVVLYQPQIPQNTGNIGRLCVATQTPLYLVEPLGFFIDSKQIRRSGLDYWLDLQLSCVSGFEQIQKENPDARLLYFSTKGKTVYTDFCYRSSDLLVFGNEGAGLPPTVFQDPRNTLLTIPMWGPVRSLNLATSVGIALYEAYRQLNAKEKP